MNPQEMQTAMMKAGMVGPNKHKLDPLIGSYKRHGENVDDARRQADDLDRYGRVQLDSRRSHRKRRVTTAVLAASPSSGRGFMRRV